MKWQSAVGLAIVGGNMDRKCVSWESDEDAEDFDDPSCDLFYDNAVRSEQRELKMKELRKKERRILR